MGSIPNEFEVISNLVEKGWISLRQMAALLGYKELRSIYPRQKGRNAIPTIKIGGVSRVYLLDAIEAIKTSRDHDEAQVLLSLLETAIKDHERREKQDA